MLLMQGQETEVTSEHIAHLEIRLRELRQKMAAFSTDDAYNILSRIIHKPGWTTVAEARFFETALDSIEMQLDALKRDHQNLANTAKLVGPSN